MSEIANKMTLIEDLASSGNFTPIAIKILIDIALSFDELSYDNYIEILKGAHVVIRNDSSGFYEKWKSWAKEKLGTCIDNKQNIVKGLNTETSCLEKNVDDEVDYKWISYGSDRWSSHPSVSSISLRGKKKGNVVSSYMMGLKIGEIGLKLGESTDQYEINMGHNLYGSTFSMLCGVYEWRDLDNYTNLNKYHNNYMLDPKKIKTLGLGRESNNRDYLVTWFQFEQYAATTHNPNEGSIKKAFDTISHCADWVSYKLTRQNIGPFGRSKYTENPWKPLYIHCCPDVCVRKSISKGKHNKTKIKDVNYSSGEICQGSVDYLKQKFGFDDRTYINKQRVLDIIMERNYCYSNSNCHSDQIFYKGKGVKSCGSISVQSILDKNHRGGKKKKIKRKTIRKFHRKQRKTRKRKKSKYIVYNKI